MEVRASFEQPSNIQKRMWKFLNSAFGLWILSSIALAFVTWSYSQWQASAVKESERHALVERITTEIAGRLRNGETLVHSSRTREQLYTALVAINGGANHINFDFGVFPEFRLRTLQSLLYELDGIKGLSTTSREPALKASLEIQRIFTEALNTLAESNKSDQEPENKERERVERAIRELASVKWAQ